MNISRRLVCAQVLACLIPWASAAGAERADLVLKHGVLYTQDPGNPRAQAIALRGREILYVGTDRGVQAHVGAGTQVIDLKGRMVLPGFVEAHIHTTMAILAVGADLQTDSQEELLGRVKAWADAHPEAKVIRGFGWRYTMFPITGPTKAALDRLFPDRPVLLVGIDGHSAWVNSKALQMAGITAQSPDPVPGLSYYQRDPATHEPTGWVVEGPAEQEILARLDPMEGPAVMKAVAEVLPRFSAAGITSAFDAGVAVMPTEPALEAFQKLEREGQLPIRLVCSYYWNNPAVKDPVERTLALKEKFHSELVQARTLKITIDGGEAQHTAVMLQPYADRPGFLGDFAIDRKAFEAAILKAQAQGLDTHAHCYGDGAVRAYLDAVEAARKAHPGSPSRHAAAHVIFLADQDVRRFAKLNVTLQSSAEWAMPDPTMLRTSQIVGEKVAYKELHRLRSVLGTGGRVALGSDWPASGYVSTFKPLDAIQVAVTRAIMPQYGKDCFKPVLPPANERITLDQALRAATLDAAYILGMEDRIGSLKAGKLADLVVLEKDLHKVAPVAISTTPVRLTVMNGRITFREGI